MKKPDWFKVKLNTNENFKDLKRIKNDASLHTVCEEAKCPNIHECWSIHKTATFMVLGDTCTRRCRFCAVKTGSVMSVDNDEPLRLAQTIEKMDLDYVVITMVTRDDLKDGGATIVSRCVSEIKKAKPSVKIETLTSNFNLNPDAIKILVDSNPDIISHNIETVESLTPTIRSRIDYHESLKFFDIVLSYNKNAVLKSSIMLGFGEQESQIIQTMKDLLDHKVYLFNMGQYLQPTHTQVPVVKYWHPDEFKKLKQIGLEMGFANIQADPLTRSSYHAQEQYDDYLLNIVNQEVDGKSAEDRKKDYEENRKSIHPLYKNNNID